jgi:hypothetical protein
MGEGCEGAPRCAGRTETECECELGAKRGGNDV